jgi:hypothetical protein
MGKAVYGIVLVALESAARDIPVVAAFVESRTVRTLAQGRRGSFLAATWSMVRVRRELLEGARRGAESINPVWTVTLICMPSAEKTGVVNGLGA